MRLWQSVVLLVLLSFLNTSAKAQTTFAGGLTNGQYRWDLVTDASSTTRSGEMVLFKVFRITNVLGGTVSASVSPSSLVLIVYDGAFDPLNLNFAHGYGVGSVNAPATAQFSFKYLVVCGANSNASGSFSGSISGTGFGIDTNFHGGLTIHGHPRSETILTGTRTSIYVYAEGRRPHSFQWYYGPRPANTSAPNPSLLIADATNWIYQTPVMTSPTSYWCYVANSVTNRRSQTSQVNVVVGPATFSGSLTSEHDTWERMTSLNVYTGVTTYYERISFEISISGDYTVQVNSVGFPASLTWYNGYFDSSTPAQNFYAGTVDNAAGELIFTNFMSAGTYDLVIGSLNAFQTGTFTGFVVGAGTPSILPGPTTPSILFQSSGATIRTGRSATLEFSLQGAIPRRYQWYSNNTFALSDAIAGATNRTYVTPTFTTVGDRYYWARVTNSYGAATTQVMTVRVLTNAPTFTGDLRPGNRRFYRPDGASGFHTDLTYYKQIAFRVQEAGTYTTSVTCAGFNGSLYLYYPFFLTNDATPYDISTSGSPALLVTPNLPAASTPYYLVISTRGLNETGTFSGTVQGPSFVDMMGIPAFTSPPLPQTQTFWRMEQPTTITVTQAQQDVTYEWYQGNTLGRPIDGNSPFTNGVVTNRMTPEPAATSRWFWARAYNSYGYDDSDLAAVTIRPPPVITGLAPTNFLYANNGQLGATVTNAPFLVTWQVSPATTWDPLESTCRHASLSIL